MPGNLRLKHRAFCDSRRGLQAQERQVFSKGQKQQYGGNPFMKPWLHKPGLFDSLPEERKGESKDGNNMRAFKRRMYHFL